MRFIIFIFLQLFLSTQSYAFCGFYVAREDGELYNEASKVVFARNGRHSIITMASDYRGPASDFAMVVPTPHVLNERQIRTVAPETVTHLDNYTAPRLVEYHDYDPCGGMGGLAPQVFETPMLMLDGEAPARPRGPRALGVRVEAEYAIGEYDIVILSAQRSDGLVTYLNQEGYNIPDGAEEALAGYIAGGMKFFVARVNLDRHAAGETQELRPLQISFRSDKFMLPLQLGKVNSAGTQDMVMFMLTPAEYGRVEAANYENARIPSDQEIPVFIRDMFSRFYKRMFDHNARPNTVYTEYAWDMGWCDPCAEDPLNLHELIELGAIWVRSAKSNPSEDVYVTRMHIQYTAETFSRDLQFNVTFDTENFQGRFIMNNPFEGDLTCEGGREYIARKRQEIAEEATTLQRLTNWQRRDIDSRIRQSVPVAFH